MVNGLTEGIPTTTGNMATIAVVGALRMTTSLALGNIAVMAENALCGGLVVRKRCDHRSPGVCGMTGIAQVAG